MLEEEGKTQREIVGIYGYSVYSKGTPHLRLWHVAYKVTDYNGKGKGQYYCDVTSVDEAGAALKALLEWKRRDKRNERERSRKRARQES